MNAKYFAYLFAGFLTLVSIPGAAIAALLGYYVVTGMVLALIAFCMTLMTRLGNDPAIRYHV